MKEYFAHPTAVIEEPCTIGKGTKIWHFCHIMEGCTLGKYCNLGQNVVVSPGVRLGEGCKIQNNVSLYSGVQLEAEVFVGPSAVFTNVINPRAGVNRRGEYQDTLIGKGATIGANATILCGINIGAFAFIGAGAVVTKSVWDYALVVGNPARQVGWMSAQGFRLQFDGNGYAVCPGNGAQYRLQEGKVSLLGVDRKGI